MNEVFYTVQVGDCDRKFREGTTYLDIAKEYQHEYEHDIVLDLLMEGYRNYLKH